jgi:CHAD domain-containing protein
MAYRFRISETLGAGARRIAREITGKAVRLASEKGRSLAVRTHEARKGVKKLRGLVRLVAPASKSPEALKDTYRHLRRAAKILAGRRDHDVIHITLNKIAAEGAKRAGGFGPRNVAEVFKELTGLDKGEIGDAAGQKDFAEFTAMISALRRDIDAWNFHQSDLHALDRGYIATYNEARNGMLQILEKPTDKRLHGWRRLVKYHFYHARLLESIKAGSDSERIEKTKLLEEILGNHHDLVMLKERIKGLPKKRLEEQVYRSLLKQTKKRRRALEVKALSLASDLFADVPAPRLVPPAADGDGRRQKKPA